MPLEGSPGPAVFGRADGPSCSRRPQHHRSAATPPLLPEQPAAAESRRRRTRQQRKPEAGRRRSARRQRGAEIRRRFARSGCGFTRPSYVASRDLQKSGTELLQQLAANRSGRRSDLTPASTPIVTLCARLSLTCSCQWPASLIVEQSLLLLELEAPFDKRGVQLARRRMAKRWHPDIAPPGPPARAPAPPPGDQRSSRPARATGRGIARRPGQPQRRQGLGGGRPPRSRGRGSPRLRGRAARPRIRRRTAPSTTRSAPASPTTRSSTATPAACHIRSGASAPSAASTSLARATTSSSGRECRSRSASGRFRPGRCSSSTSQSPIRAPTASSGS